ncbi:hypothetical protein BASA50_011362, partial [Batrachochytrium salamandrivorans]
MEEISHLQRRSAVSSSPFLSSKSAAGTSSIDTHPSEHASSDIPSSSARYVRTTLAINKPSLVSHSASYVVGSSDLAAHKGVNSIGSVLDEFKVSHVAPTAEPPSRVFPKSNGLAPMRMPLSDKNLYISHSKLSISSNNSDCVINHLNGASPSPNTVNIKSIGKPPLQAEPDLKSQNYNATKSDEILASTPLMPSVSNSEIIRPSIASVKANPFSVADKSIVPSGTTKTTLTLKRSSSIRQTQDVLNGGWQKGVGLSTRGKTLDGVKGVQPHTNSQEREVDGKTSNPTITAESLVNAISISAASSIDAPALEINPLLDNLEAEAPEASESVLALAKRFSKEVASPAGASPACNLTRVNSKHLTINTLQRQSRWNNPTSPTVAPSSCLSAVAKTPLCQDDKDTSGMQTPTPQLQSEAIQTRQTHKSLYDIVKDFSTEPDQETVLFVSNGSKNINYTPHSAASSPVGTTPSPRTAFSNYNGLSSQAHSPSPSVMNAKTCNAIFGRRSLQRETAGIGKISSSSALSPAVEMGSREKITTVVDFPKPAPISTIAFSDDFKKEQYAPVNSPIVDSAHTVTPKATISLKDETASSLEFGDKRSDSGAAFNTVLETHQVLLPPPKINENPHLAILRSGSSSSIASSISSSIISRSDSLSTYTSNGTRKYTVGRSASSTPLTAACNNGVDPRLEKMFAKIQSRLDASEEASIESSQSLKETPRIKVDGSFLNTNSKSGGTLFKSRSINGDSMTIVSTPAIESEPEIINNSNTGISDAVVAFTDDVYKGDADVDVSKDYVMAEQLPISTIDEIPDVVLESSPFADPCEAFSSESDTLSTPPLITRNVSLLAIPKIDIGSMFEDDDGWLSGLVMTPKSNTLLHESSSEESTVKAINMETSALPKRDSHATAKNDSKSETISPISRATLKKTASNSSLVDALRASFESLTAASQIQTQSKKTSYHSPSPLPDSEDIIDSYLSSSELASVPSSPTQPPLENLLKDASISGEALIPSAFNQSQSSQLSINFSEPVSKPTQSFAVSDHVEPFSQINTRGAFAQPEKSKSVSFGVAWQSRLETHWDIPPQDSSIDLNQGAKGILLIQALSIENIDMCANDERVVDVEFCHDRESITSPPFTLAPGETSIPIDWEGNLSIMGNQPIDIIIRVRKVGQEQGLTRSLSSKTFLGAHVKTAPSRFLNKLANLRATLREPSTWNESQNNEPGFQRPQSQQLQMLSVQDLHSASCSSFSSIGSSASKSEGRSNSILRRSNSVSQVTMGRYTIPDAALWTDSLVCTIREEYVSFKPSPSSSWQQNRNSLNDTDCIGAVLFRAAFIPAATCAEPGLLPEKMLEVEGGIHTRELHAKVWKEGHLYQEGGDLRWWKRRYFLLTGDKLIGYHEQTREQIVLIDLSQLDTVRYYSGHHDYSAPPVYSNDNLHGQVLAGDRDNTYSAVDANQQQLSRSCTDPDSPYVFTLEFRDGRSIALRIDVSDEQMRRVNGNDIESMRNDWIDAIEASHYLLAENQVPSCAPKVELSSGLRLIYAGGFSYAKPGDLRKAMQGARIRTS